MFVAILDFKRLSCTWRVNPDLFFKINKCSNFRYKDRIYMYTVTILVVIHV